MLIIIKKFIHQYKNKKMTYLNITLTTKKTIAILLLTCSIFSKSTHAQSACEMASSTSNKIINGSFENGITGWSTAGGTMHQGTAYATCSGHCGQFAADGGTVLGKVWQEFQTINAGTSVLVRGFAGTHAAGMSKSPKMMLSFYNISHNLILRKTVNITTNVDIAPYMPTLYTLNETAPTGTKYTAIEMTISGDWLKLDGLSLITTTTGVLPLQLISFKATPVTNINILEWNTENEVNTSKFEIEHSLDGLSFSTIATTDAISDLQNSKAYNYKHAVNTKAKSYYRLKIIDKNGSFSYSNIISIVNDNISVVTVSVFPNPFVSKITVQFNSTTKNINVIKLIDQTGKIINRNTQAGNIGINTITLQNLDSYATGIYFVEIWNGANKIKTEKIVKY
jgi:hypothetical protein